MSMRSWPAVRAVVTDVASTARRHRLSGTAAEMSFFAVLALVPLTVAFGALLGYVARFVGSERVEEGRDAAIVVLTTILSPEMTSDVVEPFVRSQLADTSGGLLTFGLLVALWLGSRVFLPALYALDLAHGVPERRSLLRRRLVALGMAVGSLAASVVTLIIMIVGPLLGGGQRLATRLSLARAYELAWGLGRWPVLLAIVIGFLVCFYRFGPSTPRPWRACVPGAVVGVGLWFLVALGFRLYLAAGGQPGGMGVPSGEELVGVVGRTVGAVVATMLWTFLSSLAILVGGELNAGLARRNG